MHKFISSKLQIDLSNVSLTVNEENNWFADRFYVKYSYPFSLEVTDELLSIFGDLQNYNSELTTYIEGDYVEQAILTVDSIDGSSITLSLKYGYDEFPSFDKKLQELILDEISVDNIYNYANTIVNKCFPETTFNFPQIITDKYNKEDTTWKFFEGRLNNRINNIFLENTVSDNDEMVNRNVIHPCVYLFYVLQRGFEVAGFEVAGDFTQNELAKKMLLYADKDQYLKREINEPLEMSITTEDSPEWTYTFKGIVDGHWSKSISIPRKG